MPYQTLSVALPRRHNRSIKPIVIMPTVTGSPIKVNSVRIVVLNLDTGAVRSKPPASIKRTNGDLVKTLKSNTPNKIQQKSPNPICAFYALFIGLIHIHYYI